MVQRIRTRRNKTFLRAVKWVGFGSGSERDLLAMVNFERCEIKQLMTIIIIDQHFPVPSQIIKPIILVIKISYILTVVIIIMIK